MQYEKSYQTTTLLKASITAAERDKAKRIAKAKGMTVSGWLGMVIKEEIYSSPCGKEVQA